MHLCREFRFSRETGRGRDSETAGIGKQGRRRSRVAQKGEGGDDLKKSVACIEAVGGGKQTGRLVGTSVGAAAAPAVSGIPFVGWLAAGWIAMFGGNQGAELGGNMVSELNEDCEEEIL